MSRKGRDSNRLPAPAGALRRLLDERPADTEAVLDIVRALSSGLDVRLVLRESVQLVMAVTGCQGAVIYILDQANQRLWIRASSPGYEQWIDEFSLEVGEGLTGWTAVNRQPAMITAHPQEDPRYLAVPELNDLQFQSALTYPMISPSDRLVGVITLHTEAPREFSDADLSVVAPIASLAASAVENAQLYTESRRHVDVLRSLAGLGDALSSPAASQRALRVLCEAARGLLDGIAAAVYERDSSVWRLRAAVSRAAAPPEVEISAEVIESLGTSADPQEVFAATDSGIFEAIAPGNETVSAGVAVLLTAGGEPVGRLLCLGGDRNAMANAGDLLGVIATIAAIVIQGDRLVEKIAARDPERVFLEALSADREPPGVVAARARQVGIDLTDPHFAGTFKLVADGTGTDPEQALGLLGAELKDRLPGSITASQGLVLLALINADDRQRALNLAQDAVTAAQQQSRLHFAGGVAGPARRQSDYQRAFADARDAMRIGLAVEGPDHVVHYEQLGAQRHLWKLARSPVRDEFQDRIETLRKFDAERGSALVATLDAYLTERGNRELTSARLRIHRNTLRHRIERILEVSGIDLNDNAHHFDLTMALGIVRFRDLQHQQEPTSVTGE